MATKAKRTFDDVSPITIRTREHRQRTKYQGEVDDFLRTCLLLSEQSSATSTGAWEIPIQTIDWIVENSKNIIDEVETKQSEKKEIVDVKKVMREEV